MSFESAFLGTSNASIHPQVFAAKCRKNYDDKIAAMTERVAQQFNTYERQLLDSDRDMTEQAMQFENKVSTGEGREIERERSKSSSLCSFTA